MDNVTEPLFECSPSSNTSCWDDEAKRLNEEFADLMMPVVALMIVLMIVGIFGNTLVFIVYLHRNHRTTANIFIMYLAGTDLMACVVIHPYVIYKLFHNYDQTWTGACKIFEFAIHASLAISGLTLLAIAIDRYLAICRPVKFLDFHKHIYKFIIASFTVGIVGSSPMLVFYGSKPEAMLVKDYLFIQYKCEYTEEFTGSAMTGYSIFVVMAFLLEVIAMIVLYQQVAVVAYRSRRRIKPLQENCDGVSSVADVMPVPTKSLSSTETSKKQTTKSSYLSSQISIKVNAYPGEMKETNVSALAHATKEDFKMHKHAHVNRGNGSNWEVNVHNVSVNGENGSHSEVNVPNVPVNRDYGSHSEMNVPGAPVNGDNGSLSEINVPNGDNGFHPEINVPRMNYRVFGSEPTGKVNVDSIIAITTEPRIKRLNRTKNLTSGLKAAKLLFLVTAVYFLSWIPFFILRIIHTADSQSWHNRTPARQVLEHFLNHCFYLNNSANPIIYSIINKQFRLECWKTLKKLCATKALR